MQTISNMPWGLKIWFDSVNLLPHGTITRCHRIGRSCEMIAIPKITNLHGKAKVR